MNIMKKIIGMVCTSLLLVTCQAFSCAVGPPPIEINISNPCRPAGPGCGSEAVANAFGNFSPGGFDFNAYVNAHPPVYLTPPVNPPYATTDTSWTITATCNENMKVYFLDRNAGYVNSLGIINDTTGRYQYIFPQIIAPPPSLGDVLSIHLKAGDTYSFFLISEADLLFRSDVPSLTNGQEYLVNGDNIVTETDDFQHFLVCSAPEGLFPGRTNYVVGVEDLALSQGSDLDFNDCTFLVSIGSCCEEGHAAPEPGTWLAVGSLLALAFVMARRRQKIVD
jgi:hypothetical protein